MIKNIFSTFNIKYGLFDLKFHISLDFSSKIETIIKENIFSNQENIGIKFKPLNIYILNDGDINQVFNMNSVNECKLKNKFVFGLDARYEELENSQYKYFRPKERIFAPHFFISRLSLCILLSTTTSNLQYYINRIIASFIQITLSRNNFYTVHASSIIIQNNSFVLPGISGSGKSTLINYLMQMLKCKYLANDRLLISSTGIIHTLPLPMRIKKNNISKDIPLSQIIKDYQIEGISTTAYLRCLVFPLFDINRSIKFDLTKIRKTQFRQLLLQNIELDANSPFVDYKKLNPDIDSFINLITEKYPAYILYFNNNDLKNNKMALCMRGL